MPPTSSLEPETPAPETQAPVAETAKAPNSKAPVSFVPHDASGALPKEPVRIRTGRYGELDEHELIHLLDSIEDERARSRFRESIYISCFIWMVVVWVLFYGPRYLWHAPKVANPVDVLRQRELTQLSLPTLPHMSAPHPPSPPPKLDDKTLERLREMAREHAVAPPPPPAPTPTPVQPTPPAPVIPQPTAPTPNVHTPPPVVAEAPQPNARPNFNTNTGTASDAMRNLLNGAAHDRGGAGNYADHGSNNPLKMGGVEMLSDPQGVDFEPYLKRILADIKRNWLPLIPEEAQPPLMKQGETYIRFTILPDGNIAESSMHLDGSTHDDAINRSCWSAITTEGQFPPLPSRFHGPGMELRIHFLVNREPQ